MKLFVTGGTGYVGTAISQELVARGHTIYQLVRRSGTGLSHRLAVEVSGDLLDPATYESSLRECDAVVHLVGIIRERPSKGVTFSRIHVDGTRCLVEAASKAGIRRFIHISALGARAGAVSAYHRSKWEAEELVRASGLPHVIFRPSVIFGPGDEFVNMLAGLVRLPVTPVIGDGRYRMQPVSLRNVAQYFAEAADAERAPANTAYEIGGPHKIAYNEMLREVGRAIGRPKPLLLHQPLWLMKPMIRALDRFPWFPITQSQLTMLLEENIVHGVHDAPAAFGVELVPFAEGIREYL